MNDQQHPTTSKESSDSGFLRHPLFLLLAGVFATALATAVLVPWISSRANRNNLLQEARLKKAIEIRNKSTTINGQLNTLFTRLGMFHQDNIRLKPPSPELRRVQAKLADDMNNRYLEFDKEAWWWYKDIYEEARLLEVLPPEGTERSRKLRKDLDQYAENIRKSVTAIGVFWHACVAQNYDFEEEGNTTAIQTSQTEELKNLSWAREDLINQIVLDLNTTQQ